MSSRIRVGVMQASRVFKQGTSHLHTLVASGSKQHLVIWFEAT